MMHIHFADNRAIREGNLKMFMSDIKSWKRNSRTLPITADISWGEASLMGSDPQADPLQYEEDLQLHSYVGADPVNFTDPTGLRREVCSYQPTCLMKAALAEEGMAAAAAAGAAKLFLQIATRLGQVR